VREAPLTEANFQRVFKASSGIERDNEANLAEGVTEMRSADDAWYSLLFVSAQIGVATME
jgi:hypothetical protein